VNDTVNNQTTAEHTNGGGTKTRREGNTTSKKKKTVPCEYKLRNYAKNRILTKRTEERNVARRLWFRHGGIEQTHASANLDY